MWGGCSTPHNVPVLHRWTSSRRKKVEVGDIDLGTKGRVYWGLDEDRFLTGPDKYTFRSRTRTRKCNYIGVGKFWDE